MRHLALAPAILCGIAGPALAQYAGSLGSATGSSTITPNTTLCSGCAANGVLYSDGTKVQSLATANSGVLVTSAGGVPSISLTLPTGVGTAGCSTSGGVYFNNSGLVCDTGFKYAGSSGAVTLGGPLVFENVDTQFLGRVAANIVQFNATGTNGAIVVGGSSFYLGALNGGAYSSSTLYTQIDVANTRFTLLNGMGFAFDTAVGSGSVMMCRQAAGVIEIGTTTCNASGSLLATNVTFSGASINLSGINATTETDMLCYNTSTGLVTHSTIAQQCTVSDVSKKRDIVPIEPRQALDIALGMDPIWFHYRPEADMGSEIHAGFTMQRVASIEPRLATDTGVKYGEMNPIWAGAIQALKSDYDDLRAIIENLRRGSAR